MKHSSGRRLGVFDDDVEVAVLVEDPGVYELVLEVLARAPRIRLHEVVVREGRLRYLYSHFIYEWVGVESR